MHYTTGVVLHGIVTSKTLWASHTSFLNDSEEVIGFCNRVLPKLLQEPYERHRREVGQEFFPYSFGYCLSTIVDAYRIAETTAQDHYVLSFCTTDDPWVSKNGLLSQWRGYGQNGGYLLNPALDENTWAGAHHASDKANSQKCPLSTSVGIR